MGISKRQGNRILGATPAGKSFLKWEARNRAAGRARTRRRIKKTGFPF